MKYVMLDLFSGLGGASRAMKNDKNWEVITVDIEQKFNPTICADILDLTPDDFKLYGHFDLIWASPPCTYFSIARQPPSWQVDTGIPIPVHKECSDAVRVVFHTLWLINKLNPAWWFLENPQGYLHFIIGEPTATIDYCMYGAKWKKPTDLWGRHPPSFRYKRCNHGSHGKMGHTVNGLTDLERNPAKRAEVPYNLSLAIKESIENPRGLKQKKLLEVQEV